jgi:hypothetical protein
MFNKDGSAKAKVPAEDSHAANTSTLRNIFAKSAKLEAFDVLDTLGTLQAGRPAQLRCRCDAAGRLEGLEREPCG